MATSIALDHSFNFFLEPGITDFFFTKVIPDINVIDDTQIEEYHYAQRVVEIELHGISDYDDGDNDLFDWDGDALASAGFGVDEDY